MVPTSSASSVSIDARDTASCGTARDMKPCFPSSCNRIVVASGSSGPRPGMHKTRLFAA